ncbi:MAG TPA: hypothetical protein VM735_05750, partial [Candidatus Kapabacteria bacterium]|nr:hypothetical protein [Candidatus Kapabacteria bacterium]
MVEVNTKLGVWKLKRGKRGELARALTLSTLFKNNLSFVILTLFLVQKTSGAEANEASVGSLNIGPLYDRVPLTLRAGERTEVL